VVLLWLPFGLLFHAWPDDKLASAILGLIVAYVVGHLIQKSVDGAMPPKIKDSAGKWCYPSYALLDPGSLDFTDQLKNKIGKLCKDRFDLEIYSPKPNEDEDKVRREAFFRARSVLQQDATKSYAEQFQGMYTLSGGLALALWIAAFYFTGWSAALFDKGAWKVDVWPAIFLAALVLGVVFAFVVRPPTLRVTRAAAAEDIRDATAAESKANKPKPRMLSEWWGKDKSRERCFLLALLAISFCLGGLFGHRALKNTGAREEKTEKCSSLCLAIEMSNQSLSSSPCISIKCASSSIAADAAQVARYHEFSWVMFALALGGAMCARRFELAYRAFAKLWAITIWRDFANCNVAAVTEPSIWDILKRRFGG